VGKPREAIGRFERALKAAQERRDEIRAASLLNNLGVAWQDLGNAQKAMECYANLAIRKQVYGKEHPLTKAVQKNLDSLTQ